jgi:hypothetical protein
MGSSIKLRFYPFKDGSFPFSRWHFNMGRSLAWRMFPCPRSWERECVICDTCEARWVKDSEHPENKLWRRHFARERVYTPALVGKEYDPVIFTTSAYLFRRAVGSLKHYDCLFRGYTFTYSLESARRFGEFPRASLSHMGDRTPVPMATNKLLSLIESAPLSKQLFIERLPTLAKQKELLASSIAEFWKLK